MNKIILLAGPKGVGKSTLAHHLSIEYRSQGFETLQLSFASTLKQMTKVFFDAFDIELNNENKEKNFVFQMPQGQVIFSPRKVMQTLGTEWGRECIDKNLWSLIIQNKIKNLFESNPNSIVIIDDCRYENEVLDLEGFSDDNVVIALSRARIAYTGEHPSEQGLPADLVDFEVELPEYLPVSPAYSLFVKNIVRSIDLLQNPVERE